MDGNFVYSWYGDSTCLIDDDTLNALVSLYKNVMKRTPFQVYKGNYVSAKDIVSVIDLGKSSKSNGINENLNKKEILEKKRVLHGGREKYFSPRS